MKKSYLMIAAAAALFAACSDTDKLTNEFKTTPNDKIGFVTYTEKATRSSDENSTVLEKFHTSFAVYGWKTVTTATPQVQNVFDYDAVEYLTADAPNGHFVYKTSTPASEWGDSWATATNYKGWFYEDVRYWDKLATSYKFYAIAPYEENPTPGVSMESTFTNIKIGSSSAKYDIEGEYNLAIGENNVISKDKKYYNYKKDYMLADPSSANNQLVTLTFKHILTKFNVKVSAQTTYTGKQELKVNDLKIVGLEKEGYYDNKWTTSGSYEIKVEHDYALKNNATATYDGCYWIQTLIFPQDLECQSDKAQATNDNLTKYLYIKYSIGSQSYEAYYDLAYAFNNTAKPYSAATTYTSEEAAAYNETHPTETPVAAGDPKDPEHPADKYTLAQGSEYTLNIIVGPEPIIFDADVEGWTVATEVSHSVN